jgi:hypothetical protein
MNMYSMMYHHFDFSERTSLSQNTSVVSQSISVAPFKVLHWQEVIHLVRNTITNSKAEKNDLICGFIHNAIHGFVSFFSDRPKGESTLREVAE